MSSEGDKIEKYLSYAEELRVLAERLHSPECRAIVIGVVTDYGRMAKALQEQSQTVRADVRPDAYDG